jgi:hypothetical protein
VVRVPDYRPRGPSVLPIVFWELLPNVLPFVFWELLPSVLPVVFWELFPRGLSLILPSADLLQIFLSKWTFTFVLPHGVLFYETTKMLNGVEFAQIIHSAFIRNFPSRKYN